MSERRVLNVDEVAGLLHEWRITTWNGRDPVGLRAVGEIWQFLGWTEDEWLRWRVENGDVVAAVLGCKKRRRPEQRSWLYRLIAGTEEGVA